VAAREVENEPFNKFYCFTVFYCEPNFTMVSKPLDVLKKGLDKFSKKIKTRKEALTLRLSRMESISEADEHWQWLDHEANTVDEERVLHDLETASNYKRGLEKLDEDGEAIVKKLREWVGDIMKVAGISQLDGDV
jgi:hypothetical protein